MKNERGSILIITLSFILIFTMLGFASIHYAGEQNAHSEKGKFSTQAFWLAEAGVEKTRERLVSSGGLISQNESPVDLGNGKYDAFSSYDEECWTCPVSTGCPTGCPGPSCTVCPDPVLCPACPSRWRIYSSGSVGGPVLANPQVRNIEVILSSLGANIENAITSHGTINDDCSPAGSAEIGGDCEQLVDFSFEEVFGAPYSQFVAGAAHTYKGVRNTNSPLDGVAVLDTLDPSIVAVVVEEISIFDMLDSKLTVNTDNMVLEANPHYNIALPISKDNDPFRAKASLLIVDFEKYAVEGKRTLEIAGNYDFRGIIWIVGEAKIAGTPRVMGTVFVDGDQGEDTAVIGNSSIFFDEEAIADILGDIDFVGGPSGSPVVISWREI